VSDSAIYIAISPSSYQAIKILVGSPTDTNNMSCHDTIQTLLLTECEFCYCWASGTTRAARMACFVLKVSEDE
jgi:hypothetical protein